MYKVLPDNIQQTPQEKKATLFQCNLEYLRKSINSLNFEITELETSIDKCIKYAKSAFTCKECSERFRRIAYYLFSESSTSFRKTNTSLHLLRILIYTVESPHINILESVLKQAVKDLKESLTANIKKNENTISTQARVETKPFLPSFVNSPQSNTVTVIMGTGIDFFNDLKENKLPGYNLEGTGVFGIFVTPCVTSEYILDKDQGEARTEYYANRSPLSYFDKPAGITFNIDAKLLFKINHNAFELVILQENFSEIFTSEIKIEKYVPELTPEIPPYFYMELGKEKIKELYNENTSNYLIECLDNIVLIRNSKMNSFAQSYQDTPTPVTWGTILS